MKQLYLRNVTRPNVLVFLTSCSLNWMCSEHFGLFLFSILCFNVSSLQVHWALPNLLKKLYYCYRAKKLQHSTIKLTLCLQTNSKQTLSDKVNTKNITNRVAWQTVKDIARTAELVMSQNQICAINSSLRHILQKPKSLGMQT